MESNAQRTPSQAISDTDALRARAKHAAPARAPKHASAYSPALPNENTRPYGTADPLAQPIPAAPATPAHPATPAATVPRNGSSASARVIRISTKRVSPARTWFARMAVLVVFFLNVTCALQFIVMPNACAPAYGLPADSDSATMVAGLGVAFLMWNVTYPAVIVDPVRFHALYVVVLVQQAVGLVGESVLWMRLAAANLADSAMAAGIFRFIVFDAGGLLLMLLAFLVLQTGKPRA